MRTSGGTGAVSVARVGVPLKVFPIAASGASSSVSAAVFSPPSAPFVRVGGAFGDEGGAFGGGAAEEAHHWNGDGAADADGGYNGYGGFFVGGGAADPRGAHAAAFGSDGRWGGGDDEGSSMLCKTEMAAAAAAVHTFDTAFNTKSVNHHHNDAHERALLVEESTESDGGAIPSPYAQLELALLLALAQDLPAVSEGSVVADGPLLRKWTAGMGVPFPSQKGALPAAAATIGRDMRSGCGGLRGTQQHKQQKGRIFCLGRYNGAKDAAQHVFGLVAQSRGIELAQLYFEEGIDLTD